MNLVLDLQEKTMPSSITRTVSLAGALVAFTSAAPIPAMAADVSCKPLTDATTRQAGMAYRETATVDGRAFEKIYTTRDIFVGRAGHWIRMPANPQTLRDAARDTGVSFSDCARVGADTVDGRAATIYTAHETIASGSNLSRIWIDDVRGVLLKGESDRQSGGRTMHTEVVYSYENVQPPAGVR